jgi:Flp pilus assembly protein TadD
LDTGLPPTQARIAHIRLGDAAVKRKDDATALKEYTAAVEIAKDGSLLTRLGGVYDRLGSADKAESAYRAALALSPENAEARAGLERSVKRTR